MRLSTIKLSGFKSFVDPTTLHLPTNMTGVVGPNAVSYTHLDVYKRQLWASASWC